MQICLECGNYLKNYPCNMCIRGRAKMYWKKSNIIDIIRIFITKKVTGIK